MCCNTTKTDPLPLRTYDGDDGRQRIVLFHKRPVWRITEPPGRPGATAIAMPAVAMPVLGRPSTTQALRRPPTPMSSQCSGPHRGVVGDRGSTRDQDQIGPFSGQHWSRTPSRENSPTPSDASSGGPALSGSVGTDRIAVADAAEDGERCWNCNTPNSNYIMSLGDGFFCSIGRRDI